MKLNSSEARNLLEIERQKAKDDRWIDDGETSDIDSLDSFNYSFEFWFEQISYYLGKVA